MRRSRSRRKSGRRKPAKRTAVKRSRSRRKSVRRKSVRRKSVRRKSVRRKPKGKHVKMRIYTPPGSPDEGTYRDLLLAELKRENPRPVFPKKFEDKLYLRPDTFNRITVDGNELDEKTSQTLFDKIDAILQRTVVGFSNDRKRQFGIPKRITINKVIREINSNLEKPMSEYFVEITYPEERRGRGLEFVPKTITLEDYVIIRLKGMNYVDDTAVR